MRDRRWRLSDAGRHDLRNAELSPFEKELAGDGRILSSLAWLRRSGFTHKVADERMVIYAANGSAVAYCYSADEVVAFARRNSPLRGAGPMDAPDAEEAGGMSASRIRDLEETISYLRQRWHATIADRDEWERRATRAEAQVEQLRGTGPGPGPSGESEPKYAQLPRFSLGSGRF
jgi:hypothetical protein